MLELRLGWPCILNSGLSLHFFFLISGSWAFNPQLQTNKIYSYCIYSHPCSTCLLWAWPDSRTTKDPLTSCMMLKNTNDTAPYTPWWASKSYESRIIFMNHKLFSHEKIYKHSPKLTATSTCMKTVSVSKACIIILGFIQTLYRSGLMPMWRVGHKKFPGKCLLWHMEPRWWFESRIAHEPIFGPKLIMFLDGTKYWIAPEMLSNFPSLLQM